MKKAIGFDRLTMGACYYPEHWPESLWEDDLKRMLDAGIEVIRIAEFAWSKFEPTEGNFTFEFFDRFLKLVEKTPMKVIFCTPTATPPAWLTKKYPEVLNVDMDGQVHQHGLRRHYNYNSQVYREKSRIIAGKIAEHYAYHPSIIGWQIDNELSCGTDEFYSQADQVQFREFLKEKYGTLENLNRAWGCAFWNQEYTDWEEVYLPRHNGRNSSNPHQKLDSIRFFSYSAVRYCKLQYDVMRKFIPKEKFITTNGMFNHVDYDVMVDQALDFITYDSYPAFGFNPDRCPPQLHPLKDRKWSMNLCRARAVSPQFGVMEQQSGPGGWTTCNVAPSPKPGQDRLWTFQSIAHGADFISYFRWRTCTFGTEIYWHGILDYNNKDNRRLAEIKRIREEMRRVEQVAGAKYVAKVAIARDYDNEWDGENDVWHGPLNDASIANWFTAAEVTHTPFDFVNIAYPELTAQDLSQYELIVYPHATIATEKIAGLLKEYVQNGGSVLMGARSGYKDIEGHCPMTEMPGPYADLFGITVDDFTYLTYFEQDSKADWNGQPIETILFNDILTPVSKDCKVLASYQQNYYQGSPALTVNPYGKGHAYYFGAAFSIEAAKRFLKELGVAEPFAELVELPECCEVALREKDGKKYLFILNFSGDKVNIICKKPLQNLLNGQTLSGTAELSGFDVVVLELESI